MAAADAAVAGTRSALIVASYEYTDPGLRQLQAPASDARALESVLRDPSIGGFQVRTLLNEPAHEVNLAVEEFFADRRPGDLLLVHFSCHGVKDEGGDLYFATSNTVLRRLGATAVGASFVNRCMSRSRSRRIVLLLDCCYAGAFERGMTARAGTGVGIEAQFGGRGRAVITASSAMEYAFEGETLADTREPEPSVFTSALVKGLETGEADRDQDGLVALDELYDYIYDTVRATTPHQTPGKWAFGVQGELVIARRSCPVTTPAQLPRELQEAIDSPLAAVRAAAVQELARLLTARHAGVALAARQALERFTSDDSRTVAAAAIDALGSQAQPPAAATSPHGDMPAAPAPGEAAAAPAAATPTAGAPADTVIERPAPNAAATLVGTGADSPASSATVSAEKGSEAPAPAPTISAGKGADTRAATAAVSAEKGGEATGTPTLTSADQGYPAVPATSGDSSRRVAGVLAIAAAILGFVGLFPTYETVSQGSFTLAGLSFARWSSILAAVVDLIAGVCLFSPRTRRWIGPGILLGNVAVSSGWLVFFLRGLLADNGFGAGFWLELAASLAEVSAACLAGVAVARSAEVRLSRWPARAGLAWPIVLIGAAAAVALVVYSQKLSGAGLGTWLPSTIWTAVMALIVPLVATSVVPARFAVALLGGWIAGNAAVFVYYALFQGYEHGQGVEVTPVPVIIFGLALAALVPAIVLFARATPSAEGHE